MASISSLQQPFFFEYEKMVDHSINWDGKKLRKIRDWVVLEKIHGANLSIYISISGVIEVAKRSSFLSVDDAFFGFWNSDILSEITPKLYQLLKHVVQLFPKILQFSLHGELFGGIYNHCDVMKSKLNVQAIQKAVMYHPELQFIVFDISLYYNAEERVYLDYDMVMVLCETFNLLCCKPLFCGCFAKAQHYQLEFPSTISSLFSLPEILDCSNFAEGIVIKPLKNTSLPTTKGFSRVIFKRKHPKFIETKSKFLPLSSFKPIYGGDILIAKYELFALLNTNRIQSAISKSGYPKDKVQISSLQLHIIDDIFEEYIAYNYEEYSKLSSGTVCHLKSILGDELSEVLESEFSLNIVF